MKALLLTHIFPTKRAPTRGTFNRNCFAAIANHCDARIVSPQPFWSRLRQPGELLTVPHETQTGVEVRLPTYWSVPRAVELHGAGMYASLRPYLSRLRRDFSFDVILAAWAYPDAVAASYLARDFGCPLVVNILGSDINAMTSHPGLRRQIQEGLHRADRIVTVSGALRERVLELGVAPERVLVQHNGVNGDQFLIRDRKEVRSHLNLSIERPALCYVGRLSPEKGVDVLVEAMGVLAKAGRRDIDLHIVGGGRMEDELRARTVQLGLESQVHFRGGRPHDEIPLWISACDVFCLPSRSEGCPNVVLEALASGRPVVASRVGGVPELLTDSNGIMVPSENPEALADGIQQALTRTWDSDMLRGTVECLSWNDVGRKYCGIMASALSVPRVSAAIAAAPSAR
jgi:glycosyltransferase involved in cell wall biosynthesis